MKALAFDKQSVALDMRSNRNCWKTMKNHKETARKSIASDKNNIRYEIKGNYKSSIRNQQEIARKSIAFDTKSNGSWRTSIRNQWEIARKSIALYETPVAFDKKSNGICRSSTRSKGKHYEISSIRYEIKWKLYNINKKSSGTRC